MFSALKADCLQDARVRLGSDAGRPGINSGATHLGLEVVQGLVGGHGRLLAGGSSGLAGLGGVAEDDGGAHGDGVLAVENGELATLACVEPSSAASTQALSESTGGRSSAESRR